MVGRIFHAFHIAAVIAVLDHFADMAVSAEYVWEWAKHLYQHLT